jgi:hypothetical protein
MDIKRVLFRDLVDEKQDDKVVSYRCKEYDGSLKTEQDKSFATFCIEWLEKGNIKTVDDGIDKIKNLGIDENNIQQFVQFCYIEMQIILEKLIKLNFEKEEEICTNLEKDPVWDAPRYIESAKNKTKRGVSLLRICCRDSSRLAVKFTVEWIPYIQRFLKFLQKVDNYYNEC